MANILCKFGASLAMGRTCPALSGRTCPRQTISKYHVTAPFKMQEKKLTMFYTKAHDPFVIKIYNLNQNLNTSLENKK